MLEFASFSSVVIHVVHLSYVRTKQISHQGLGFLGVLLLYTPILSLLFSSSFLSSSRSFCALSPKLTMDYNVYPLLSCLVRTRAVVNPVSLSVAVCEAKHCISFVVKNNSQEWVSWSRHFCCFFSGSRRRCRSSSGSVCFWFCLLVHLVVHSNSSLSRQGVQCTGVTCWLLRDFAG